MSYRCPNGSHSRPVLAPEAAKTITYILSILSAAEAKKSTSKRVAKNQSMQLSTDEPWDTMKAQILAKISMALNPPLINFDNYDITFFIPRVLPKPGLALTTESDFTIMNGRARNIRAQHPTINLLVVEKKLVGEDKENDEEDGDLQKAKSKGKVSICTFYDVQFYPTDRIIDSQRPCNTARQCQQEPQYPGSPRRVEMSEG
jgi:hypothetical protein